jgi:uncharacterized protein YggE
VVVRIERRLVIAVALAALVAAGATVGGLALAGSFASNSSGATIDVTATGLANGTPDLLNLEMGVSTNASSATASLAKNNTEMARLQRVFLGAGVKPSDLQTSDLSISPNYGPNGNITGYGTTDSLSVTFRQIAKAGQVIDAAANAVGNDIQLSSVSFSISNSSSLLQRARASAMHAARIQASDLASASGQSLGPVVRVTDDESSTPPSTALPSFAAAKAAVPIQAGSEQVSVQVEVVYALSG